MYVYTVYVCLCACTDVYINRVVPTASSDKDPKRAYPPTPLVVVFLAKNNNGICQFRSSAVYAHARKYKRN